MTIERLAQVIVTYNRPQLLRNLLGSVLATSQRPWRVIVVDNASTDDETPAVLADAERDFPEGMLQVFRSSENTGGSGGFAKGVELAIDAGAKWCWLMDDDVEVLPDALEALEPWTKRFRLLHGRRLDTDGKPFYWQAKFNQFLAVPLPYTLHDFNEHGYAVTNSGTFEGMLIASDLVRQIGLPDSRFFISWDDAAYAWVASRYAPGAYVDAFTLQKKRDQKQISLGFRHFNDSPVRTKYYVMRNRGYIWQYFRYYGQLDRIGFGVGTLLTFAKEVFRIVAVEHGRRGLDELVRGMRDAAAIRRDEDWRPMPPV